MLLRHSRSLKNEEVIPLISEIERLSRENRDTIRRERMAKNPRLYNEHVEGVGVGQFPNEKNGNPMPVCMNFRDIQRSVIGASASCIRLSPKARNYELKNIHFTMLPSFHGLPLEVDFLEGVLHPHPNISLAWVE